MVQIEFPHGDAEALLHNVHNANAVHAAGLKVALEANKKLNVGPVARFWQNRKVRNSLIGVGGAILGGLAAAGGLAYANDALPSWSTIKDTALDLGQSAVDGTVTGATALYKAAPGQTGWEKGLVIGGGGLLAGGTVWGAGKLAMRGLQKTRDAFRDVKETSQHGLQKIGDGAKVVFEDPRTP